MFRSPMYLPLVACSLAPSQAMWSSLDRRLEDTAGRENDQPVDTCASWQRLAFSSLIYSNLGGHGPDFSSPEGVLYGDVFPGSKDIVDLIIATTDDETSMPYYPNNSAVNGLVGQRGCLSFETGNSVWLMFTFLDRKTSMPITPPPFHLSFLDLGAQDRVAVPEAVGVDLSDETEVTAIMSGGDRFFGLTTDPEEDDVYTDQRTDSMLLTHRRLARSATFTMSNVSKFMVSLGNVGSGNLGRNFEFDGSTPLSCPARPSCKDYLCPIGYTRKADAELKACYASPCDESDATSCCDVVVDDSCRLDRHLSFSPAQLVRSNLNGEGPDDTETEEDMIVDGVFPGVDATITVDRTYSAADSSANIITPTMWLQTSFAAGQTTDVVMKFASGEKKSEPVGPFFVSAQLVSNSKSRGQFSANLTAVKAIQYSLAQDTALTGFEDDNGTTITFPQNTDAETPADPLFLLSPGASRRTASLKFQWSDSITFRVATPQGSCRDGWTLRLGGASSLVCTPRPKCESFTCPRTFVRKAEHANLECSGSRCTDADIPLCCDRLDNPPCTDELSMVFLPNSVIYSNLAGKGPDKYRPRGMSFGNVFPHSGRTVDLEVNVDDRYEPYSTTLNGMMNSWGRITMKSGLSVNATFTLYDRATGERFAPTAPWHFSFVSLMKDALQAESRGRQLLKMQPFALRHTTAGQVLVNGGQYVTSGAPLGSGVQMQNPRDLSYVEMTRVVTLLMPTESQFTLEITNEAEQNSDFYFGGASSVVCPRRALCSSYTCPTAFKALPEAAAVACRAEKCDAVDLHTCCVEDEATVCGAETRLVFKDSHVLYSNLGGKGPDFDRPEALVVQDVMPERTGGPVDLEVTVAGDYSAAKTALNGVIGGMLWINAATGSETELSFRFTTRSGDDVDLEPYGLSVFDFDMQKNGEGVESLVISTPRFWITGANTTVNVSTVSANELRADMPGSALRMMATAADSGAGNPRNSLALTREQKQSSVSLVMSGTGFGAKFGISNGFNSGRNLMLGGASNILCEQRHLCNEFTCPIGYRKSLNTDNLVCKGRQCEVVDKDTCCEPNIELGCGEEEALVFDNVVYSNLGNQGPDFDKPEGIVLGDVVRNLKVVGARTVVDLNITCGTDYRVKDPLLNAAQNGYLTIGQEAGKSLRFNWTFVNRATQQAIELPHFLLTAVGLSTNADGEVVQTLGTWTDALVTNLTTTTTLRYVKGGCDAQAEFAKVTATAHLPNVNNIPPLLSVPDAVADASVTFTFAGKSTLDLALSSSAGCGDTLFQFGGRSTITCPGRQSCSAFQCPVGMTEKKDARLIQCAGETCDSSDANTCCDWMPTLSCKDEYSFVLDEDNVLRNNLGGNGPDQDGDEALIFGDVFPYSGRLIDVAFRAVGNASVAMVGSDNGIENGEGHISMNLPGPMRVNASFIDRATGKAAEVGPFLFSFLGLRQDRSGFAQVVDISGAASTRVLKDGLITVRDNTTFVGQKATPAEDARFLANIVESRGGNTLGLPLSRLARVASAQMLPTTSFEFTLRVECSSPTCRNKTPSLNNMFTFGFAGKTNLICPQQTSCASFRCPVGFLQRTAPETRLCAGRTCTDTDMQTCCQKMVVDAACEDRNRLVFDLENVVHSNLNGQGPNTTKPPSILFGDVFPFRRGSPIDLEMVADELYRPAKPEKNSVDGSWARINVKTGNSLQLKATFIDRSTGLPTEVGPYHLTILDVDRQKDGRGQESVKVTSGFLSSKLTPTSEVMRDGIIFSASEYGNESDNVNAFALTPGQLDRTVSVLLPRSNSFAITLWTSPGWASGRNFFLGGASNLVCSPRALCSTYTCPAGWDAKDNQKDLVCKNEKCSDIDRAACCNQWPSEGCDPETIMTFGAHSLFYSNIGGLGPDVGSPQGMLFGNAFPRRQQDKVDLMVTSVDGYNPVDPSKNGLVNGVYGSINMACNTTSELKFEFIDRETSMPKAFDHPVYFTIFDFTEGGEERTTPEVEVVLPADVQVTAGDGVKVKDVELPHFHDITKIRRTSKYRVFRSFRPRDNEEEPIPTHPLKAGADAPVLSLLIGAGQSSFNLKFRAWIHSGCKCKGGRTFVFGGASSKVCPKRETCADFICPAPYTKRADALQQVCQGLLCSAIDVDTCCTSPPQSVTTSKEPCKLD